MGTNALVDVDKQPPDKPRKKRERIELIEVPPGEDWFQQARDNRGRPIWFFRLKMTGLRTRRYGPFPSQHKGLLFLDRLINAVAEALCSVGNDIGPYQVKNRFGYRGGHYPVTEDELIEASNKLLTGKKGR